MFKMVPTKGGKKSILKQEFLIFIECGQNTFKVLLTDKELKSLARYTDNIHLLILGGFLKTNDLITKDGGGWRG